MKKALRTLAVLAGLLLFNLFAISQTVTLVSWDFPNDPDDATADGGITANTSQVISAQNSSGTTPTVGFATSGNTTNSATATGWDGGNGVKWWEISFSTTGYQTIKLSSRQKSSSTGPRDWKIQYKIGSGGSWTNFTGNAVPSVANNFTSGVLSNLALPAAVEQQSSVYLRWIMTSNTSVGGGTVAGTGTSRVDDIVVTGVSGATTVDLSINTSTASEAAATSITLTATASAAVTSAQTVDVALTGTGLSNSDFSGVTFPATITIANGATTGTKTFTIADDLAYECTENATFTISNPSGGLVLGSTTTQALAITDNDLPAVNLSINTNTASETGATSITLTATSLAVLSAQSVTINLSGTGLSNSDFSGVTFPATINIAGGGTSGSITFTVNDDVAYEGTETATFTMVSPTSCIGLGVTTSQNLTIADNDLPSVNLSINTATGSEAAATAVTLTATSAAAVSGNQTVTVGLSGTGLSNSDFTGITFPATITILNGQTTGSVSFNVADDAANECTETATFTISNPSAGIALGATTSKTLAITDNDQPAVNLSINTNTGAEAGATSITLTATAASAVVGAQTVTVGLSGTGVTTGDFTGFTTTITIPNGSTTGSITFAVNNDGSVEGTETATFTISNPSACVVLGATLSQNLVITDDDFPAVNLSISPSSGTEAATTSVTLTATAASAVVGAQTVTVSLSGSGLTNADFTGVTFPATITIANGATTGSITFAIADDNVSEGAETATFTISAPSAGISLGGTTTRNLAITDNPLSYIVLTALNSPALENFAGMGTSSSAATQTGFAIQDGNTTSLSTTVTQQASTGSPSAGGSYNWGQNGTSDRALGLMFSGGYNNESILAAVKNSTGTAGTIFEIKFNYEQYRRNTASQTFKLQYATSLTGTWSDITGGAFTNMVTGVSSYDFNTLMASQSINIQYSPTLSVPNGNVVYFRWILDGSGNSSGVGIDDVSIALITTSCSAPATQAHHITFSNITQNAMDVSWTSGNGDSRVVYMNSSNSFTAPTDGATLPGTNTVWANAGQQLIYNGTGTSVSVSNLVAGTTYYFRAYDYNCTSLNTKFNTTTATLNPNSQGTNVPAATASVIQAVSGSEANSISSLTNGSITSSSQGTQVWQFKLFDGNGTADDGDGLPTVYTQWTIRQGTGNTVPNWSTVIDNVKFFKGSSTTPIPGSFLISNTTISFTPVGGVSVAQGAGSFEQITMRLTLDNPMAPGSDGLGLTFKLASADVTVDANTVSSQLAAFTAASNSAKNIIDVTATLEFIDAPAAVVLNSTFSTTVSAIDANGNVDQNQTTAITLAQTSGAGSLTGGATHNLVNGTYTFTGLSYNQVGTFQITASASGFSPISATINCTNDPFQSFDDFNRTDNDVIGIPSSGGTTAWTESGAGDGSRQRVEAGQLILSNCNSDASSSSNGFEQVVFDATGKYSTTFNNANGSLNWLFNMRSSRSSPSGFSTTNTYGAAFVLGCTQSDYTSASANGYAVVIGNAGSPDPAKLVYFTGGLTSNANVTDIATSSYTGETDYLTVKVTFNPCTGQWSLFVRNDGSSAFASPITGSLGTAVTGTNTTYSNTDLKYFGAAWQHGASCSETVTLDNIFIPNASVAASSTKTWNGSVAGGAWNDANNWSPCPGVPTATDNVIIPATSNNPVISTTPGVCKDLTINAGVQITINSGFSLTAGGNWTGGSGTAATVTGAGVVILTGTTAQTLSGKTVFETLRINKASGTATMQAGSTVDINTAVELQSGTLATGSGTLTFKSTSTTQIAVLDNFTSGYTGNLTGNITAERFYNATGTTNQHYMGSPVSTTLGSFGAGGNSGFVTPSSNCSETQLASTSVYGSVFSYDQSNGASCSLAGWKVEASGTAAAAAKGFSVTKTGSGKVTVSGAPNLNSSYTQAGTNSGWSNTSLQGRPMTAGWVLVSNPYLAYLDFSSQGAPANFTSEVKVWRTTGAFAGTYQDLQAGEMIAPFQAFFVHSNSTGNYPISGAKRTRSTAGSFHALANDQQLNITAANNTTGLADMTFVAFNSDATAQFDNDYDAQKIAGTLGRHTLYTVGANNLWMSKNVLNSITTTSTVTMGFEPEVSGSYTFSFEGLTSFDPTSYIMLEDRKLNLFYNVRNGDYTFTADSADQWERFVLHFTPKAEITAGDQNCSNLGTIDIAQPGTANWNYTIADNNNNTIASGTLNETSPVHTSAANGTYTLTLTDNNNYTVVKMVTVNGTSPILAGFSPSASIIEEGNDITFNSSNTDAVTATWNFGDGTTDNSNSTTATHTYTTPGTYTVTLTVTNAGGCSSSMSQTVTVSQKVETGITNLNNKTGISIWSHENRVYIDFSQLAKTDATVNIYNILGQELVNERFGRSTIYNKAITNLEAAYVIVKVKNGDAITTKKVFIANGR